MGQVDPGFGVLHTVLLSAVCIGIFLPNTYIKNICNLGSSSGRGKQPLWHMCLVKKLESSSAKYIKAVDLDLIIMKTRSPMLPKKIVLMSLSSSETKFTPNTLLKYIYNARSVQQ